MPPSLKKLTVLANLMANDDQDVISHEGQYQLSSGQAISGHSPLYGRVMPYLPFLELHEHYYIRGPISGDKGAIELFAKLAYDHMADLCSTDKYIILGLFVDHRPVLDQDRLEEDQAGAEKVLIEAATQKKLIYVKLYYAVGWRYVEIHKYYMMHYLYVDHAEDKHQAYFQDNPIYLYQNVFLSLEEGCSLGEGMLKVGTVGQLDNPNSKVNFVICIYLGFQLESAGYQIGSAISTTWGWKKSMEIPS
eukprot:XP_011667122.1 PREDICTED: uncharacterized protein LOC105439629 [Strongylocentrotus purpuratus]